MPAVNITAGFLVFRYASRDESAIKGTGNKVREHMNAAPGRCSYRSYGHLTHAKNSCKDKVFLL